MSDERMPTMDEVRELTLELSEVCRDKAPTLLGAALLDIVATFFAGHHPSIREEVIDNWIKAMRDMIPINEAQMFEAYGKPEGWESN